MRLGIVAACVAALLAGCGAGGGGGTAQVWITRDRGQHVLAVRTVPAGLTGMQALDRVAKITTRYGGRFVQSIDGVEGSLSARRDWFYFVNGIEADRSAAELRLHAGDVEWWDLRSWANGQMSVPVVVGAWPKPVEGDVLVISDRGAKDAGRALARSLHANAGRHRVLVVSRPVVFHAERNAAGKVTFTISAGDALRLARNPKLARFRYEGLP
ncbi:MAG: hypothetical protein QOG81_658 [Gaiellaceae bacterium]|nr:hypothetical protein [Gaiellaceae bacterium]MDX6519021.1 hypothetical protein [Gaiellaceae bacterium]